MPCDENEDHQATVFCTVCSTHLCDACAVSTHSTKTLSRHKHVPLSEKSKEKASCSQHPPHIVEYACMEQDCVGDRLMCFVCKDYGRHQGHKVSTTNCNLSINIVTNLLQQNDPPRLCQRIWSRISFYFYPFSSPNLPLVPLPTPPTSGMIYSTCKEHPSFLLQLSDCASR